MDPERFKQLGLTAVRWAYHSHRLYIAAQVFARPEAEANKIFLSQRATRSMEWLEAIQHARAYTDAGNLLYGLAIENAYKTRQILDGRVSVEKGEFKGMLLLVLQAVPAPNIMPDRLNGSITVKWPIRVVPQRHSEIVQRGSQIQTRIRLAGRPNLFETNSSIAALNYLISIVNVVEL